MTNKISKNDVNTIYKNILLRNGDESGINHFLEAGIDLETISQRMKNSFEYKNKIKPFIDKLDADKNKKILLFGAFGNGNLGDAIQQTFVKKGLVEAGFKGSIWACSHLNQYYNFDNDKKIPHKFIESSDFLKKFDLIIVGGGGLLAHPHYPLNIDTWAEKLETPVALLAVGASVLECKNSSILIEKACHVSGRDETSVLALSKYRDKVHKIPDPVLCMQEYNLEKKAADLKTVWVLKGPMNEELKEIRNHVADDDVVICFQKKVDEEIEVLFPELVYTPTAESFYKSIKGCNRVFSMRYHGLILSLSSIDNVYAMGDPKNLNLMKRLGVEKNYFRSVNEIKNIKNNKPLKSKYDHIYNKDIFLQGLRQILNMFDF